MQNILEANKRKQNQLQMRSIKLTSDFELPDDACENSPGKSRDNNPKKRDQLLDAIKSEKKSMWEYDEANDHDNDFFINLRNKRRKERERLAIGNPTMAADVAKEFEKKSKTSKGRRTKQKIDSNEVHDTHDNQAGQSLIMVDSPNQVKFNEKTVTLQYLEQEELEKVNDDNDDHTKPNEENRGQLRSKNEPSQVSLKKRDIKLKTPFDNPKTTPLSKKAKEPSSSVIIDKNSNSSKSRWNKIKNHSHQIIHDKIDKKYNIKITSDRRVSIQVGKYKYETDNQPDDTKPDGDKGLFGQKKTFFDEQEKKINSQSQIPNPTPTNFFKKTKKKGKKVRLDEVNDSDKQKLLDGAVIDKSGLSTVLDNTSQRLKGKSNRSQDAKKKIENNKQKAILLEGVSRINGKEQDVYNNCMNSTSRSNRLRINVDQASLNRNFKKPATSNAINIINRIARGPSPKTDLEKLPKPRFHQNFDQIRNKSFSIESKAGYDIAFKPKTPISNMRRSLDHFNQNQENVFDKKVLHQIPKRKVFEDMVLTDVNANTRDMNIVMNIVMQRKKVVSERINSLEIHMELESKILKGKEPDPKSQIPFLNKDKYHNEENNQFTLQNSTASIIKKKYINDEIRANEEISSSFDEKDVMDTETEVEEWDKKSEQSQGKNIEVKKEKSPGLVHNAENIVDNNKVVQYSDQDASPVNENFGFEDISEFKRGSLVQMAERGFQTIARSPEKGFERTQTAGICPENPQVKAKALFSERDCSDDVQIKNDISIDSSYKKSNFKRMTEIYKADSEDQEIMSGSYKKSNFKKMTEIYAGDSEDHQIFDEKENENKAIEFVNDFEVDSLIKTSRNQSSLNRPLRSGKTILKKIEVAEFNKVISKYESVIKSNKELKALRSIKRINTPDGLRKDTDQSTSSRHIIQEMCDSSDYRSRQLNSSPDDQSPHNNKSSGQKFKSNLDSVGEFDEFTDHDNLTERKSPKLNQKNIARLVLSNNRKNSSAKDKAKSKRQINGCKDKVGISLLGGMELKQDSELSNVTEVEERTGSFKEEIVKNATQEFSRGLLKGFGQSSEKKDK